jgi:hypothetical protein
MESRNRGHHRQRYQRKARDCFASDQNPTESCVLTKEDQQLLAQDAPDTGRATRLAARATAQRCVESRKGARLGSKDAYLVDSYLGNGGESFF